MRTDERPGKRPGGGQPDGPERRPAGGPGRPESVFERIYEVVRQIPRGTVATYGQVARLAGNARWARVVGYALHVNPDPDGIPCYRVVTRDGRVSDAFAFGGGNRQRELLEADGVRFEDGHVVMEEFAWEPLPPDDGGYRV